MTTAKAILQHALQLGLSLCPLLLCHPQEHALGNILLTKQRNRVSEPFSQELSPQD